MKKKITRPKRNQSEVIRFIEGLPEGMISSGKASDLMGKEKPNGISQRMLGNTDNPQYLVDIILGLNDKED